MEELILKTIIGTGSGGLAALFLYFFQKKAEERAVYERELQQKAQAEVQEQLNARIASLETHVKTCEDDRTRLWSELVQTAKNINQPKTS